MGCGDSVPFSWNIHLNSVSLDGNHPWAAICRWHTDVKSGLWLGHSSGSIVLKPHLDFISVSCWKVNFHPSFRLLDSGDSVLLGLFWILMHSHHLQSWPVSLSLSLRSTFVFTTGIVFHCGAEWGDWRSLLFTRHKTSGVLLREFNFGFRSENIFPGKSKADWHY